MGDSSKQVVTKATETKSESPAVGIQAVRPFAMGIPMDPAMMRQMAPFISPIRTIGTQAQQSKTSDDQHPRRPSPSPAHPTSEDGEAVGAVVHHTPEQTAVKRENPVDLTSDVPQRKRLKMSTAEGVLSATPPTSGSPDHGLGRREEPATAAKGTVYVECVCVCVCVHVCMCAHVCAHVCWYVSSQSMLHRTP